MNSLMEKQLDDLQQENASITSALKESHSLCELLLHIVNITCCTVDRQSDGYEQAKNDNTRLCEQLSSAQEHDKTVSSELAKKKLDINELEKRLQFEQEEKCNKVSV